MIQKFNQLNVKHVGSFQRYLYFLTEDLFTEIQVSDGFKESLKFCLGNIFELIEKQTRSKLNELKSIKNVYIFEVFKFKL